MAEQTNAAKSLTERVLDGATFNLFASVMGTAGLGLAWRASAGIIGAPAQVGEAILAFSALVFVLLLGAQLGRLLTKPRAIAAEWRDPIASNFLGAATIGASLLSAAVLPYDRLIAQAIWIPTAALQLWLLVAVMGRWIAQPYELVQAGPIWLIPMVGNASLSFAGAPLGYIDVSWLLLAAATISWLGFLPIFLQRLIFATPKLPERMAPSLAILVSAPAIISLGLRSVTGHVDDAFRFTAFAALFFAILVLSLWKRMFSAPFSRVWWAFTFPTAALASAMLRYHEQAQTQFSAGVAMVCLGAASLIVAVVWLLSAKSALSAFRVRPLVPTGQA